MSLRKLSITLTLLVLVASAGYAPGQTGGSAAQQQQQQRPPQQRGRGRIQVCAQQNISGVAADQYATLAACRAGRAALAAQAATDAVNQCDDFCRPTGCTAVLFPANPRGNPGTCRGPINNMFYGDATTGPVTCRCTSP